MTFDCKIVKLRVHKVKKSTIKAVNINASSIYCIVRNTTTAGPPTPTTSPLPTTTATQGSKKTHETPVTIHDPENKTMVTEAATQEIITNEPNLSKRKNDSISLLYGIISSNYLLVLNTFTFVMLYLCFLKTLMKTPDTFAILMLI